MMDDKFLRTWIDEVKTDLLWKDQQMALELLEHARSGLWAELHAFPFIQDITTQCACTATRDLAKQVLNKLPREKWDD